MTNTAGAKSTFLNRLKKGFTLTEIIVVVVLLGILAAGGAFLANNIATQGRANTGARNAATINTIMTNIRAAGGVPVAGSTAGNIRIPTASDASLAAAAGITPAAFITTLATGFTVGGIEFRITPAPTAASYTMGAAPDFTFTFTGTNP